MVSKILVVDDVFDDLQMVKNILAKEDFEIVTVVNGAQALDACNDHHFDLCLLDVKMPILSGYDLVRLLRERLDHKISIIFVTIMPEDSVDMSGVDGFIQKPFTPEQLLNTIKKVLKNS